MNPREELARLQAATRAHLEREARKGKRRLPRAEAEHVASALAATSPAAEPAPTADPPTPESTGFAAPIPSAAAAPTRPAPPREVPVTSAAPAGNRALAAAAPDLATLQQSVAACEACDLCQTRKNTVFLDGSGATGVLFIGEAPGADEDERGVPFVGRAGQLLTDIITKGMKLERSACAIANVLKCRPPENRDPTALEKERCTPFLDRQIELLDPKVIITLGRHASNHILGTDLSMGRMRGRVHVVKGRKVVCTYHPAYLLRSPGMKKECWKDIQLAMAEL